MSRLRRAPTASTSEDGFTVIELVMATGLMFIVITAMLYTTVAGFRGIAVARGRQAANGIANQTVEQVRALPYATLSLGLSNSDSTITGDTAISRSGAVWTYGGETIPHGDNPVTTPLNPHQQSVPKGTTTYTVSTYLTYYTAPTTTTTIVSGSQPGGSPFRLTVVVQWKSPTGAGTSQVQAQTILYSPSGCLSSATHPFSAPCQAFLYATSAVQGGSVTMTGPISGIPLDHAALWLPSQSSGSQIEQIQAVQGTAQTSGVTLQLQSDSSESSKGRQQVSSGSDNDPGQPKPDYQTASTSAQSSDNLFASGNGNQLTVSFAGGDTASTMSTVSANTAAHPCPMLVPASSFDLSQDDAQPCGNAKGKQGGTLSGVLSMLLGTQTDTTMASVGAASTPSGAFTNRDIAPPEATVCATMPVSTPPNDGCVQAKQYRTIGTVILLQLPVGLSGLPGYDPAKGLVKLTGYADSVSAEAGVGAAAPAATISAGTIEYYDGATYQTMTPSATATRIPFGLQGNGVVAGNALTLQVSVTGDLWTGGTSVSDPAPSACPTSLSCRNEASATAKSPLLGSLTYSMSYLGTNVATVTTAIDLGTLVAKSSYTAAPNGS